MTRMSRSGNDDDGDDDEPARRGQPVNQNLVSNRRESDTIRSY